MMTTKTDIADDFDPAPPEQLQAQCRRRLSAMLDGELSPDESKFLLRRLGHDHVLAGCWERWQVAGDVLRGQALVLPSDFPQRVARAIAADAGTVPQHALPQRGWLQRWGGSLALAASVAAVTFVVARQWPAIEPGPAADDGALVVAAAAPSASLAAVPTGVPAGGDAPPAADAGTPAVAATALAAAATQRRRAAAAATARRAAMATTAETAAAAPALAAVEPAAVAADADRGRLFGLPDDAPAQPRPWPRAVLSGVHAGGPLAAGYGGGAFAPAVEHDLFAPRLQAEALAPAAQAQP